MVFELSINKYATFTCIVIYENIRTFMEIFYEYYTYYVVRITYERLSRIRNVLKFHRYYNEIGLS